MQQATEENQHIRVTAHPASEPEKKITAGKGGQTVRSPYHSTVDGVRVICRDMRNLERLLRFGMDTEAAWCLVAHAVFNIQAAVMNAAWILLWDNIVETALGRDASALWSIIVFVLFYGLYKSLVKSFANLYSVRPIPSTHCKRARLKAGEKGKLCKAPICSNRGLYV